MNNFLLALSKYAPVSLRVATAIHDVLAQEFKLSNNAKATQALEAVWTVASPILEIAAALGNQKA